KKRLSLAAATDLTESPQALGYWIGKDSAIDRLLLAEQAHEAAMLEEWTAPRLPLSGGQLIARGMTEGPTIARTLKAIERAWVEAGFPDGDIWDTLVAREIASAGG
ncbi:MAG: CCA tRNA nucleotidyltransferase, partial [Sphingomicrobium sp.]